MFRNFMLLAGVVGMIMGMTAVCGAVQVDGYCFLSGPTNHAGTKVLFQADSPGAITDSTYTNSAGHYQIDLSAGFYDIYFSHQNFTNTGFLNIPCFSPFTLPIITLYLLGNLSGILDQGSYVIGGDIAVQDGDSLIVLPGTTFLFNGNFGFFISGYICATGTESDSIRFMPNLGVASWSGIDFNGSSSDSSLLMYCKISGSSSDGIYCDNASPRIIHCTINYNSSTGIVARYNSNPVILNCTIENNISSGPAGGIICDYNSNAIIEESLIVLNSSAYAWGGGGIYAGIANPSIRKCTISGNDAPAVGGGIHLYQSGAVIENTIIDNNTGGGGIYFLSSPNASISYCNLNNNPGGSFSGSIPSPYLGWPVITNANGDSCDIYFNIFEDPMFVGSMLGDFHLQQESPCIDAGNPSSPLDPDSTIADMGAFYFDQSQMPALEISADSLAFPVTIIGGSSNLPLTLYNIGTANLIISQVVSSNAAFTTSYAPADSIILPGDSLNFVVNFSPDSVGLYMGALSISSNGGNAEVVLSGEGISPVSVDLEPLYEPIFIYPWGGEVGYYLSLYNNTTAPQTFDIWIDILKPDSSIYGPVILRNDLTFAPSYHVSRLIIQSIPASAPSGSYSMRGHVGDYQTQDIWSEDSFPFTKVEYNDGRNGQPVSDWSVSGWDSGEPFPGEENAPNSLLPFSFFLFPCHPNPFNPTTVARYELPTASRVKLSVYDISGREVAVLVDGWREAGAHEVTFDASGLAAGIYFARLEAGEYVGAEKMVLLK